MKTLDQRIKSLASKIGCDYETAKFILLEVKKSLDGIDFKKG